MNFFKAQQQARSSTKWLIFLFILAVLTLVVFTDLLVMGFLGYIANDGSLDLIALQEQFNWPIFVTISCAVILVVLFASLYKMAQLKGGGASVAEMMGATLITGVTQDLHEKRLLNVVEEMAIASGTPVPPVYLMQDEQSINAFAAGYKPGDAVIAVTQGTLHKLTRAQLQGVIAHEFSHVLNGDMRLNIRLIGILHGILIIGIIGYYLMRISTGSSGSSRNNKDSNGSLVALGLGLMIIGYAGTFFGNIIKARVSRKREYLADASAVQFTRDPQGIAGALSRIGGEQNGSNLEHPKAAELSHAYFSEGVGTFFNSLMATHPALDKRIKAIDPGWDGSFDYSVPTAVEKSESKDDASKHKQGRIESIVTAIAATEAINQIGQATPQHITEAQQILSSIPDKLLASAHEPFAARAVIYLLVLDKNLSERNLQLQYLKQNADSGVYMEVKKLVELKLSVSPGIRLALVDIALSSLHQLSKNQYQLFSSNLKALIEMDNRIELFEWALQKIVFHYLDPVFNDRTESSDKLIALSRQKNACQLLLSLLLLSNKQEQINLRQVFNQAMNLLGFSGSVLLKKTDLSLHRLNSALDSLNNIYPLEKPQVLKACAFCITADNVIQPMEAELFRAIASILDCPMPPLIVQADI